MRAEDRPAKLLVYRGRNTGKWCATIQWPDGLGRPEFYYIVGMAYLSQQEALREGLAELPKAPQIFRNFMAYRYLR